MIPKLLFLLIFLVRIRIIEPVDYDEIQLEDNYETRSRILMVDGNIWFHAGLNKNITFHTSGGGSIFVNGTDVTQLPDLASYNDLVIQVGTVQQFQSLLKDTTIKQMYTIRSITLAVKSLLIANKNMTAELKSLRNFKRAKSIIDAKRRVSYKNMSESIRTIRKELEQNACLTHGCENGGSCIARTGDKFVCLCPPHFTGSRCEADVDECDVYQGSSLGCQNGTCYNTHGGFRCDCFENFHGTLCDVEKPTCSRSTSNQLCGSHGHCVENESEIKYKCSCDAGYKQMDDKNNPYCVDINECESNPCHPGIKCLNLPGTYQCNGCPTGYKMSTQGCVDIDECTENESACDPNVQCSNTIGSYQCSPCPAGYSGDSKKKCTKTNRCSPNPCPSPATCKENDDAMNVHGYICTCPHGYSGGSMNSEGRPDECVKSNSTICEDHKCVNGGTCKPINDLDYKCDCDRDYIGKYCEKASPCFSNPCKNDGVCKIQGDSYICQCSSNFFGENCENQEGLYDVHITNATGTFVQTIPENSTSHIRSVYFNIPQNNAALKLKFTTFNNFKTVLSGPTDCETTLGKLSLFDGPDDHFPMLATFCGDENTVHAPLINNPITMTSTSALLRFKGTAGDYSITWETVSRDCGYRTSKSQGLLEVPDNKQDIVCEWFISAPATKVIEITVPSLQMHSKNESKCEQNKLVIYDGYSSYDMHRIIKECSDVEEPITVRSTGPYLTVSFISNMLTSVEGLNKIRGFSMSYKFVDSDRSCGGDIVNINQEIGFTGSIQSPNFGSLYPPNMDCTWNIFASGSNENDTRSDLVIKLTIDEFDILSGLEYLSDIEGGFLLRRHPRFRHHTFLREPITLFKVSCKDDYVRIYNGDGNLLYDACNRHRPRNELYIESSKAVLNFHSNDALQGKGFNIQYEVLCQQSLEGNGSVQTWNFPNGGKAGKCTYIIKAPRTHLIHIKFKTINLQVLTWSECLSSKNTSEYQNYVEIEGGREDNTMINRRYFCQKQPFSQESTLSVSAIRPLKITVNSDGNEKFRGISFEYSSTDVGCGGIYSSASGSITSPNYPEKYQPHLHCVYDIMGPLSKAIKLTFEAFDLESTNTETCEHDRVEVYSRYVDERRHSPLLGKFCGALIPPQLYSPIGKMTLVFITDRSVSSQGFNAKFEVVDRKEHCDRTFTAPSGEIVFSQDDTFYDKCEFHIAVPDRQRIVLKMNNMSLPCEKARIKIRNGPTSTSPPFSSLYQDSEVCDQRGMPILRTSSNRAIIIFTSTATQKAYFNISYEVISGGCGGRIDGLSGSISAPQYPLVDRRSMNCEWTIAVADGNKVRFNLAEIDDLKSSDNNGFCPIFAANRLDILDTSRQDAKLLRRYCQKEVAPEPVNSDDNELIVRYVQSGAYYSHKLFGFLAHFTTICDGILLTDISGSIQSPGYPHNVYSSQMCSWTIRVPLGNRIIVNVHHFVIDGSIRYGYDECFNYLKVDDIHLASADVTTNGVLTTNTTINKYCDAKIPLVIKSKHNEMHIKYSSKSKPENQFWLSYHTLGCVGEINYPQELRVHKDMIDGEFDDFECQYKITAPFGKKVKLIVHSFNVQQGSGECAYTSDGTFKGLAVFMGSSNASGVAQQTLCTTYQEHVIESHTDQIFLLMKLNRNDYIHNENLLFNATVLFVDAKDDEACGAVIDLRHDHQHTITSPSYPSAYPSGIACRWLFLVNPGNHIEFSLEEYHSPNPSEATDGQYTPMRRYLPPGLSQFSCLSAVPYSYGMLTIYDSNSTTSKIINRFCNEQSTSQIIEVYSNQSLVTFSGATTLIGRKSGTDDKQKIGFVLKARSVCGGVLYAESKDNQMYLEHNDVGVCNITVKKANAADTEVHLNLDIYETKNHSAQASASDFIEVYSDNMFQQDIAIKTEFPDYFEAKDEIELRLHHETNTPQYALLRYSSDDIDCGGFVHQDSGKLRAPNRGKGEDIDCTWTIFNTPGNTVNMHIISHNLPSSENCTESYVEVREFNASGRILSRQCDPTNIDYADFTAQSIYVYLRYRPDREAEDYYPKKIVFFAGFEKIGGGDTTSNEIQPPDVRKDDLYTWTILGDEKTKALLIKTSGVSLSSGSYLRISQASDNDDAEDYSYEEILRTQPDREIFLPFSTASIYAKLKQSDKFKITWEPVAKDYLNRTKDAELKEPIYDCGGELVANWEWQSFSSPLPAGQSFGYEENVHCKWTLNKPLFAGIEMKFEYLDLEDDPDCRFDFVAVKSGLLPSVDTKFDKRTKYCSRSAINTTFAYAMPKRVYVHFVSDRSRHGRGFKMSYRLTCMSVDFINPTDIFEEVITSPNYPLSMSQEMSCQWTIVSIPNRRFNVEVVDLDMFNATPCDEENVLTINDGYLARTAGVDQLCGPLAGRKINVTTKYGQLVLRYRAQPSNMKGFKLRIREVLTECPTGIMRLDENHPTHVIYSPEYPEKIPPSSECEYVVVAPNGHRIALSFDPDQFAIESSMDVNDTSTDFLEIRDGPSQHSSLIGRFNGNRPPSTIYSNGNYLYMRLRTDSFPSNDKFIAKFEIATCGGTIIVRENQTIHITSPNYPDPYDVPVLCKWKVRSPNTHMLMAKLEHMWLSFSVNCTSERLLILDGNETSTPLFPAVCNQNFAPDDYTRSSTNELTIIFNSSTAIKRAGRQYCNNKKCGFDVAVKLSEIKCGGEISDSKGIITLPGYPGRLLKNVGCRWKLKAKPGYKYSLKMNFTDQPNFHNYEDSVYFSSDPCYADVQLIESPSTDSFIEHMRNQKKFCKNALELVTESDFGKLVYNDLPTRELAASNISAEELATLYAPFVIEYMMIPADHKTDCTYLVNQNTSFIFSNNTSNGAIDIKNICHFTVEKPEDFASVSIKVENFGHNETRGIGSLFCDDFDASIILRSDSPMSIDQVFCERSSRTNRSDLVYINNKYDIFVQKDYEESPQPNFTIHIEFQRCGGHIKDINYGNITSPNYGEGNKYLANSRCQWLLEAPPGQVVKIKVISMDIHYDLDCPKDRLMIGEGKPSKLNLLHQYCHTMMDKKNGFMGVDKLEDRFKQITSKSRYMTINWITDDVIEAAGWVLEYEFVNEADTCGYHAKGMSGVVESPKFGLADYEGNQECIWDIQVPLGYHINLKFTDFDVQQSENCTKDRLVVSEMPNYLAKVPAGNYLFVLNDAKDGPPLCGTSLPEYKETETTRVRLNFTTDEKVNGRGFRMEWQAKCGAIFESNHGVITSPNYPDGYPNEDQDCEYLIKAEPTDVVALKFDDLDISKFNTHYDRSPCKEDYVQVLEHPSRRPLITLCGDTKMPGDAITVKGSVKVKFVASRLFIGSDKKRKNERGFKLAYNINYCGGDIHLSNATDLSAEIESPAFPLPYVRDLDCIWNITTSPGREINIKFEMLDMEELSDCSADYVELFNSPSMNRSLGKFCGGSKTMPTNSIRTTGPNLLVRMVTDHTIHSGGFKLVVTSTLGAKNGCGGQLIATDDWQSFTQPRDENGTYPGHLHCGWTVKAPVDYQIRFRINDIDTEKLVQTPGVPQKPFCTADALAIYDGLENLSPPLISDVCSGGTVPTGMIVSSGRYAFVYFTSDHGGNGRGFNISYSIERTNCGGWKTATYNVSRIERKSDSTEEAGNLERTHERCKYMIEGNKKEPVIIRFTEFRIPSSDKNCENSYVEIRDVGSINECQHAACARQPAQRKITKLCGTRLPAPHISNTNVVQIIVSTELRSMARSSVTFEYQLLDRCNRTIDTNVYRSGRLTSPNYPNIYEPNSRCTTVLENSANDKLSSKLLIAFSKFVLEIQQPNIPGSSDCSFDYLDIIDEAKNTSDKRICGVKVPPSIYTTGGGRVATFFTSDHIINQKGYDATYYTVAHETDDVIEFSDAYDLSGVVTNIGWPNGYNKSMTQIFTIRPPTSHSCIFDVDEVNLGVVSDITKCRDQDEYLAIEVMYRSEKKNVQVRDCSYSKEAGTKIQFNADDENRYFKITFKSDGKTENDGRGFRILWECDNFSTGY